MFCVHVLLKVDTNPFKNIFIQRFWGTLNWTISGAGREQISTTNMRFSVCLLNEKAINNK